MSQSKDRLKPSFFDSEVEATSFWKQTDPTNLAYFPTIIECEFSVRNKKSFFEWETITLTLKGNFLLFENKKKANKLVNYIDFENTMYQFRAMQPDDPSYSKKYKHAFTISANKSSVDFYAKDSETFFKFKEKIRSFCVMTDFQQNFNILEVLGSGGYAQVYLVEEKFSRRKYAAKVIRISKEKSLEKQKIMITNEIKIMKRLDHQHIIKLREVYEMDDEICLIEDYIGGARLFDYIVKSGKLSEFETALIISQLLLTLSYMENEGVIHRDIKPENILFAADESQMISIRLIDFGLATYHYERETIKKCGTAGYTAPEVLLVEPYDFKADLYSVGIVTSICLTGKPVFRGPKYKDLVEENKNGRIEYPDKYWSNISPEAKDFVQNLLHADPNKRMSLDSALNHAFFAKTLPLEDLVKLEEQSLMMKNTRIPKEHRISNVPKINMQVPQFSLHSRSSMDNFSQSFNSKVNWSSKTTTHLLPSLTKEKSAAEDNEDTANTFMSPKMKNTLLTGNTSFFSKQTTTFLKKDTQDLFGINREDTNFLNLKTHSFQHRTLSKEPSFKVQPLSLSQDPLDGLDAIVDDEGSPLADKYHKIKGMNFCFNQVFGSGPLDQK